ncbi:MAG: tetratricopeptide repeat protein, partial [Candidatus Hermodarchaeota archaeon]
FLSFQRNYIPQTHDPNKVSIEKDKRMDPMDKRQIFSNIIYKIQGNYEKALKYYKGALKKAEKSDDLYEKLKNINAIGEIYQIQGLYLEAVKKFEEALEIARLIENESLKFKLVSKIRELYNKIFKIS